MKWFKSLSVAALAIAMVATSVSAAGAASSLKGKIVINGSSALLPLTLQAANEFKKLNPKVKISASAAGSITGPQSVRKGIADIGAVDWDAYIQALQENGYAGYLTIEREVGDDPAADIAKALRFLGKYRR